MSKVKVIVDYSPNRYSDMELTRRADNIVFGMAGNPKFASLEPKVTLIKNQNETFKLILVKVNQGGKTVTIEKNAIRHVLEDYMASTAIQVQDLCNGDEGAIISAGFEVKRKPTPVGLLERPEKVVAKPGPTRGSLEISWEVVPNARMYEVEIVEYPETDKSVRQRTSTTKHKIVIDGLIRGQAYAIQVAGAGSDPGRVWSDAIISYVM
jgi:hypothetical protein